MDIILVTNAIHDQILLHAMWIPISVCINNLEVDTNIGTEQHVGMERADMVQVIHFSKQITCVNLSVIFLCSVAAFRI